MSSDSKVITAPIGVQRRDPSPRAIAPVWGRSSQLRSMLDDVEFDDPDQIVDADGRPYIGKCLALHCNDNAFRETDISGIPFCIKHWEGPLMETHVRLKDQDLPTSDLCPNCNHPVYVGDYPFCNGDPDKHRPMRQKNAQSFKPMIRYENPKEPGHFFHVNDYKPGSNEERMAFNSGYTKLVELTSIHQIDAADKRMREYHIEQHQHQEAIRLDKIAQSARESEKRLKALLDKPELKAPEQAPDLLQSTTAGKMFIDHAINERRNRKPRAKPEPQYVSEVMAYDAVNRIPHRSKEGKDVRD